MTDEEKLDAVKLDLIKSDKDNVHNGGLKRTRGPPKNEDIWQHFTKLKDAGKYHNYWYVECKSCRNAYQMNGLGENDNDVPIPSQIVSRIPDMRRHLNKCKNVSDYIPETTMERTCKNLKLGIKNEKSSRSFGIDKDDKELKRREMEHRWDMERRRMTLEEQKNARIDQKLARQEEEAQINRRVLVAKAQEAELQLKVAQAKARQELLHAGMTHEEIDVVLHRSTVNQTRCPLRESMIHFISALRSLDSWKREQEELAPLVAELEHNNSPFTKSPASKSSHVPRLLEFMEESKVQINFLARLPSIERCLRDWWIVVSNNELYVTPSMLTTMYSGLASILMEARTPTIQQSAVKIIAKSKWCKWEKWDSAQDPPLTQAEFASLVFQLGYLLVPTDTLQDYTTFFQSTLTKLSSFMEKHLSSKASISERRHSRLHRESIRGHSRGSIVLHSSQVFNYYDDNSTIPHVVPFTITQFKHERSCETSSQVVGTDLTLLSSQFQKKFHPVEHVADEIQVENAPPMRISTVRSMNRKLIQRIPPLQTMDPLITIHSLQDIDKLMKQCTLTFDTEGHEESILRRSISHPQLRQRLRK